ncbi:MAG: o-succinylbenzoate synthase, partial [Parabacteroides sp.]|nr:o-succinylbenzoate synthase [Parabacteroides sp.]
WPGQQGIGECAPLPQLSQEDRSDFEAQLAHFCRQAEEKGWEILDDPALSAFPSIRFGLETAFLQLHAGRIVVWDTPFTRGEAGIPINGLIWMGDYPTMLQRIEAKLQAGFRCIKLKIGAIDFEQELALLRHIRAHFSAREIELRVDANGAFTPADALTKLQQLAELDLHSIEQPIRAGQWEEMARLCSESPLPIALDEELIGVNQLDKKRLLLETIHPTYIILKPSLHGGLTGCEEWIRLSREVIPSPEGGPSYWVTSALESNIGLTAIAQWCAALNNPLPQGLGTGMLFTDNWPMPLEIRGDQLWFIPEQEEVCQKIKL